MQDFTLPHRLIHERQKVLCLWYSLADSPVSKLYPRLGVLGVPQHTPPPAPGMSSQEIEWASGDSWPGVSPPCYLPFPSPRHFTCWQRKKEGEQANSEIG